MSFYLDLPRWSRHPCSNDMQAQFPEAGLSLVVSRPVQDKFSKLHALKPSQDNLISTPSPNPSDFPQTQRSCANAQP